MTRLRQLAFSFALFATATASAQTNEVVLSSEGSGPAVIYDDKEISQEELGKMSPASIGDIKILSGEEAEAKFGKYGEHGVVLVTSPGRNQNLEEFATMSKDIAPAEHELVEEQIKTSLDSGEDAHVIIDGKVSDMATLRAMSPDRIAQMQVHKGMDAIELFGNVAKSGAIVVTTKQN